MSISVWKRNCEIACCDVMPDVEKWLKSSSATGMVGMAPLRTGKARRTTGEDFYRVSGTLCVHVPRNSVTLL